MMRGGLRGLYELFDLGRRERRAAASRLAGARGRHGPFACVDGDLLLSRVPDGTFARVLCLRCGERMQGRLDAMGIVPGAVIEKRSSALRRGPVLVAKGAMQLALAYDLAERIVVEAVG